MKPSESILARAGLCLTCAQPAREPDRRRIPAKTERALEAITHAIEYLTTDFVAHESDFSPKNAQLQAVQILMELNKQVYLDCEPIRPLTQRIGSMLRRQRQVVTAPQPITKAP